MYIKNNLSLFFATTAIAIILSGCSGCKEDPVITDCPRNFTVWGESCVCPDGFFQLSDSVCIEKMDDMYLVDNSDCKFCNTPLVFIFGQKVLGSESERALLVQHKATGEPYAGAGGGTCRYYEMPDGDSVSFRRALAHFPCVSQGVEYEMQGGGKFDSGNKNLTVEVAWFRKGNPMRIDTCVLKLSR